jgi:hypothetical protein
MAFWAAASALWALAAAVRARPPYGRARPSPLHIKKALALKWYYSMAALLSRKSRYQYADCLGWRWRVFRSTYTMPNWGR